MSYEHERNVEHRFSFGASPVTAWDIYEAIGEIDTDDKVMEVAFDAESKTLVVGVED